MNRGLAIIALAALIGAALAAAVTLPALVVSGEDSPPAALSIAPGSKRVVVRARALPTPRTVARREPGKLLPPAQVASSQSSGSALISAPASGSTAGTTGTVSRNALNTKAEKRAKPAKRIPPPPSAVVPPPPPPPAPPPPPPPAPPESKQTDQGHKQKGPKGKHKEKPKAHDHGDGQGKKDKEHGHGRGHDKGDGQDKGKDDKGKDDEGHAPKR